VWEKLFDYSVYRLSGLDHDQDLPRPAQAADKFFDTSRWSDSFSFGSARRELVRNFFCPVKNRYREAFTFHVENQVLAHYRQAN
jgi:hypothetical protein